MTKSQICTQLSAFLVVIPYYLSLRYNMVKQRDIDLAVVIPYYLSLRYNFGILFCGLLRCNSLLSLAKV